MNTVSNADWSQNKIIYELREAGWSLRRLSLESGYATGTLKTALRRAYPKAQQIIAKAIGVPATQIWPTRYSNGKSKTLRRGRPRKNAPMGENYNANEDLCASEV